MKCHAAKVPSPAALIDSAFAPLKKTGSHTIALADDEPAPDPVNGATLLQETSDVIRRFVVMS